MLKRIFIKQNTQSPRYLSGTSKRGAVSVLENGAEMTVSVADPTHKTAEIKLTLDGKYTASKVPLEAKIAGKGEKTVITAKTEGLTGETVRVILKNKRIG